MLALNLAGLWLTACRSPLVLSGNHSRFRNLAPQFTEQHGPRTSAETRMRHAVRQALSVSGRRHGSLLSSWYPPPPARLGGLPCSYWQNPEPRKAARDWLNLPGGGERTIVTGQACLLERSHWPSSRPGAGLISQKERRPLRSRCETAELDRGPLQGAARWR